MRGRGLLRNSALALLADLTGKAGMLAVLVLAGRLLPTAEFAMLAAALSASAILTALLDGGCQTLIARDGAGAPDLRAALLRDLVRARLPLVLAVIAGSAAVGAATGHIGVAALTVALSVAGAALLSLAGVVRAAQDLRPETVARFGSSVAGVALAAAVMTSGGGPAAVLGALTLATLAGAVALVPPVRRCGPAGPPSGRSLLRHAAPLGIIALATLAYYRSGAIALAALSSAEQTALFAAASTLGFGLLALTNAVTTALIPRLAGDADAAGRATTLRRSVAWTTAAATALAVATIALAPALTGLVFGAGFRDAGSVLAVLAAASIPIAVSGVLGAGLLAVGQVRPIAVQVGLSLSMNLGVLLVLVPRAGATGAALATLACELLAVAVLVPAARRSFPTAPRPAPRTELVPAAT